jgi:hypothetical protein
LDSDDDGCGQGHVLRSVEVLELGGREIAVSIAMA